ncbi:MAG: hypothetical protein ACRERX_22950 [Pseudomonas sp.]
MQSRLLWALGRPLDVVQRSLASLVTRDAQELYRKFGFTEVTDPHRYMNLKAAPQDP